MANEATIVIGDVEAVASKLLSLFNKAKVDSPAALAAVGTVLGAVGAALAEGSSAAESDGLNIALDVTTVSDLKAVWSDVVTFCATLGIKL